MEHACAAICVLGCGDDETNRERAGAAGAVEAVVAVMEHPTLKIIPEVMEEAASALHTLVHHTGNMQRASAAGACGGR